MSAPRFYPDMAIYVGKMFEWLATSPTAPDTDSMFIEVVEAKYEGEVFGTFEFEDHRWTFVLSKPYWGLS